MNKTLIVASAALAVLAVIAGAATYAALGQADDEYAVRVDDAIISEEDVQLRLQQNSRLKQLIESGVFEVDSSELPSTDRGVVTQGLIEDLLLSREALRRGVTCSDEEVTRLIDQQRALADASTILPLAVARGIAPVDYMSKPPPERTPVETEVFDRFWNDPEVRASYAQGCTTGKLFQSLDDPTPQDPKSNDDRSAAIQALKKQLLDEATIDRASGY